MLVVGAMRVTVAMLKTLAVIVRVVVAMQVA